MTDMVGTNGELAGHHLEVRYQAVKLPLLGAAKRALGQAVLGLVGWDGAAVTDVVVVDRRTDDVLRRWREPLTGAQATFETVGRDLEELTLEEFRAKWEVGATPPRPARRAATSSGRTGPRTPRPDRGARPGRRWRSSRPRV